MQTNRIYKKRVVVISNVKQTKTDLEGFNSREKKQKQEKKRGGDRLTRPIWFLKDPPSLKKILLLKNF